MNDPDPFILYLDGETAEGACHIHSPVGVERIFIGGLSLDLYRHIAGLRKHFLYEDNAAEREEDQKNKEYPVREGRSVNCFS